MSRLRALLQACGSAHQAYGSGPLSFDDVSVIPCDRYPAPDVDLASVAERSVPFEKGLALFDDAP